MGVPLPAVFATLHDVLFTEAIHDKEPAASSLDLEIPAIDIRRPGRAQVEPMQVALIRAKLRELGLSWPARSRLTGGCVRFNT